MRSRSLRNRTLKNMLIIFTGNGKGKTTASLGQALRAIGDNKKVLMVQFIKGPWQSGEDIAYKRLEPDLKIVKTGKGFVGIGNDTLPLEVHQKAASEGFQYARTELETNTWDMIILDEVWNALQLHLLTKDEIQEFIHAYKSKVPHLILTGRNCPQEFIDQADLVTEMKEIKHPFAQGVVGAKGIEY